MFTFLAIIAFIHLLGFLNAHFNQSDHLTDIIYSLSFVLLAAGLLFTSQEINTTKVTLLVMVGLWAIRLAVYLGYRVKVWGHDRRFDYLRANWKSLFGFWTLQFVSIVIISLPITLTITENDLHFGSVQRLALLIFAIGLSIETIADIQKFRFKQTQKSHLDFITSGLWKKTRHPNYLGELIVWCSIFLYCSPFLSGYGWFAIASPIWIFILLRYISGGNILEKSADKKYGHLESYQTYKDSSNILFPRLF